MPAFAKAVVNDNQGGKRVCPPPAEQAVQHQTDQYRRRHHDTEDRRVLKLLVWLNDVDLDGGPFEYIERSRTPAAVRALRYVTGYLSDELEGQIHLDPAYTPSGAASTGTAASTTSGTP